MRLSAEIDLVLGILVGTGRRKLGFGFRIQRKKVVKRIGVDLGEKRVKRFRLFLLRNAEVKTWNWKSVRKNIVNVERERAMKRANVFSLFMQMMPSSLHASTTPPEHWEFLDDIDAPQWADLAKESTLIGVQGDHPWFHAKHSHHEMSLARVEAYPRDVTETVEDKPQHIMRKKVDLGKGTVAKLLKPSFKANTVKACLGGMQRVSNVGSKDGRLSSRPRLTNQTNQPRPRVSKKVRLSRSGSMRMGLPAKTAAGRPDPRSAVGGRELNSKKDTNDAKPDKLRRMETAVKEKKDQRNTPGGTGRNSQKNEKIVASPLIQSGRSEQGSELCDSPRSSALMYRLPSPPGRTTSSPSDMAFSSGGSRKSSTSSHESRLFPSPRISISWRKLLPEKIADVGRTAPKQVAAPEPPSAPTPKEVVESRESSVDILAVPKLHQRVLKADRKTTPTAPPPDRKQRPSSPRGKRRSIGPSLRVKPIEKVANLGAKKKGTVAPAAPAAAIDRPAVVSKETGPQATPTHPILERLRKSWGSALRVKQRQEPQNATAHSEDRQSSVGTLDQAEAYKEEILQRNRAQNAVLQAVISGREKSGGAAMQSSGEMMSTNSSVRSELIAPFEDTVDATKVLGSPAQRSGNVSNSGTARKLTTSEFSVGKTSSAPSVKLGLAKMHPNQQRIRTDGGSKFKKQYAFPETGVSTTLRANKENMEMRYKTSLSPPPSVRGKTSQTLGPRSVMSRQARPAASAGAGNHQAPGLSTQQHQALRMSPQHHQAPRLTTQHQAPRQSTQHQTPGQSTQHQAPRLSTQTRSSQQPGPLATSKTTNLPGRPARPTGSAESRTPSGPKSELADTKLSTKGSLRGIAAASKPSFQKGESSSTLAKEAIPNSKGCKNGVRVADESVAIQSHKAKVAAKSEPPTTHNVKSIREWEIKSGRRYHDLQPSERQKINQQITAASKALTKRPTA